MSKYENTSQASTMTAGPAGQCIQHSARLKGPATVSSSHKVVRSVLGRSAHQFWDAAAMLLVFCYSADPVHFRVSQSRSHSHGFGGKGFPTDCALRSLSLGDRDQMFPFISDKRRRLRATDLNISGVSPPCLIVWHDVYIAKANNKPGNAPAIRMFKREMLS